MLAHKEKNSMNEKESSELYELYSKLRTAYFETHPNSNAISGLKILSNEWKTAKQAYKTLDELKLRVDELVRSYKVENSKNKSKNLHDFFKPRVSKGDSTDKSSALTQNRCNSDFAESHELVLESDTVNRDSSTSNRSSKIIESQKDKEDLQLSADISKQNKIYAKPVQESLSKDISQLYQKAHTLRVIKNSGFTVSNSSETLVDVEKQIIDKKKKLKKAEKNAVRQGKHREKQKQKVKIMIAQNPSMAKDIKLRSSSSVGQPRLEESQPELLKVISNIALLGASAEDKRRSPSLRSCKTLGQLHEELKRQGFNCSKTATYYRLLPRNATTIEGKRHVNTVNVKLCRAQSDLHKDHGDQLFCLGTIRALEELASILGPRQVIFLSQDDKARVPIGITAANKQAPFLMHMEYRVRLPDHDFVVANGCKLIPSVYLAVEIKENELQKPDAVTYSGPCYIAIRSGKHSTSNAITHADDFDKLLQLPSFAPVVKDAEKKVKPVVIITVDGGADENPRYPKVIAQAIRRFQTYDLDAIFIATNAPGRSAYNRVERFMAWLSKELAGLVIPHDHFGSHLNNQGKTIDSELEKKNFAYAGGVLAEIWNNMRINSHEVTAEYIPPTSEKLNSSETITPSPEWYARHVRESQYLLQIIKCTDAKCCKPCRSSLRSIIQTGFLPPPYPIVNQEGLSIPDPKSSTKLRSASLSLRLFLNIKPQCDFSNQIPYDLYCPSLQNGQLKDRTCKKCGIYFASKKAVGEHLTSIHNIKKTVEKTKVKKVICKRKKEVLCITEDCANEVFWLQEDEITGCNGIEDVKDHTELKQESSIPIIDKIDDWIESPWIEEQ